MVDQSQDLLGELRSPHLHQIDKVRGRFFVTLLTKVSDTTLGASY